MYLSKLDIVGFKSFAQKTNLKFTKGISAIVGPNGCGKSNIVDAIRWVLGEQKTSVLRSDVMENVIFNGTKHRKPISMAEVSLTIENNKNILPTEYNEVIITRRLFRSGESEYLLNNTKCRLRDILDLFMDTGLGSDSYSVIELKMVEAILSGKGDDRRSLFEEAAGIKKYNIQRKEADKKLNDVINDLLRVNDLVDEVRKSVASLQRHAQKTRRYNALNEEYRTLETQLFAFQYKKFSQISQEIEEELKNINKDKVKYERELADRNLHLSKLKSDFQKIDDDLNLKLEEEVRLEKEISHIKQEIAVSEERLIRINNDESRLKNEIGNTAQKLENTTNAISSAEKNIAEIEKDAGEMQSSLASENDKRSIAQQNTNSARSEVSQANQKVLNLQNNISVHKANINKNNEKKFIIVKKIEQIATERNKIQSDIDENEIKLHGVDEQVLKFENSLKEKEELRRIESERQSSMQMEVDNLRHKINEAKNQISTKKSSLDFLRNLIDTSETSKFLLNSNDWSDEKDKLMLSETIAIDDKLQNAVSVIINNSSDYFVTESQKNAQKALGILKNSKKGKASFICLDIVPEVVAPNPVDATGVIGWFSEIVRVEDKVRNVLRLLYADLLVVENREIALELLKKIHNIQACVTIDGEYYHISGAVRGGSISQSDTARIGKKEKMNNLKSEMKTLENELLELENQKKAIEENLAKINIQSITSEIRTIENDKRNFENMISQVKLKKQQLQNHFELAEKNHNNYQNDIIELEKEIEIYQKQIDDLQAELAQGKGDYEKKLIDLRNIEIVQKEIDEKAKEFEIAIVRLNSDISARKNDLNRIKQQLQNYKNTIENRKIELIQNTKLRSDLKTKIDIITNNISGLQKLLEEAKNKCDFLSLNKKSVKEQLEQTENNIISARKIYDKIIDSLHQKELKLSESNTWVRNIIQNFSNNYQIDITSTDISVSEDFSESVANQSISELKQKLQNLGSINFAAIEEFEKESERLQFLEKQIADLVTAEKTLRETIDEINQTAERNFINTFNQIRINFQNLFRKLFNEEGEADINFDANNPLESEISIIARPPNKRPNSIEQLSGGEKTLTAIALLFAIYLVKPSPFCILDEVDAPLDDANVRRFLNIINEFSKDTQFLIVTHNKTTMTAADTLYGVTMQEPGVSQTASVKLDSNMI